MVPVVLSDVMCSDAEENSARLDVSIACLRESKVAASLPQPPTW